VSALSGAGGVSRRPAQPFSPRAPGAAWPEDELTTTASMPSREHEQDLVALIEQEVMLAIPLAPRTNDAHCRAGHDQEEVSPSPPWRR